MAIKTILLLGVFAICAVGALVEPMLGVLGYMGHYCTGPETQWWSAPVRYWGIRYSYWLALATAVGLILHRHRWAFGKTWLTGQETMMLLFLGITWLSVAIGEDSSWQAAAGEDPWKLTKVILFAMMLSHIVTNMRNLNWVLWLFVVSSLMLGVQAYDAAHAGILSGEGRLDAVGGPDFRESNFLAGFLGAMLPLIGMQFLRTSWLGKALCLFAGVFTANAIVLTRSRGGLVGIALGCVAAVVLSPKKHRVKVLAGLVVALLGGIYLTNPQFVERSSTILAAEEERDASAQSRIEIWQGGVEMLLANPMGVGVNNFSRAIERYAPQHPLRDAHNTFVRCAGELGFPGIILLTAMVGNALWTLRRVIREARALPESHGDKVVFAAYGMTVGLVTLLGTGLTTSMVYTEALWWFLVLPVCLDRALENALADLRAKQDLVTVAYPGPAVHGAEHPWQGPRNTGGK
jgi:O-antigen ligase